MGLEGCQGCLAAQQPTEGRGEKLQVLSTELARRAGWSGQDVYRLGLNLKR
jgi:16S rRNA (cytidine1402-2'-O)-methyltransferase